VSHLNIAFNRYSSIGTVMHYTLVISQRYMNLLYIFFYKHNVYKHTKPDFW